ncbi:hypothetical protein F511_13500 [Dorcoceras hygrometricum]|uniref:Uncharacterized protein n=1 Tax=Dorcoceras hygrometricum TaxID=472368 RepID=A0A2Z7CGE7_9LAMI|nr:hypothetical protein F511_13500 [Dorcoceras hygrometricum]
MINYLFAEKYTLDVGLTSQIIGLNISIVRYQIFVFGNISAVELKHSVDGLLFQRLKIYIYQVLVSGFYVSRESNSDVDKGRPVTIKSSSGTFLKRKKGIQPSIVELGDADSLKIDLSTLKAKNEFLRSKSCELESEIEKLNLTMSSWTKSSASLDKLFGIQKPASDRTGLGFNVSESGSGETSTQSQLVNDKFNKMSFVKASVTYDSWNPGFTAGRGYNPAGGAPGGG